MLLRSALLVALFCSVTGCKRASEPAAAEPAEKAAVAVPAAPAPPAASPEPVAPPAAPDPQFGGSLGWRLQTAADPADGTEVVVASIDAQDEIPTRNGPQKPTLIVRCMSQKTGIIISAHAMGQSVEEAGRRGVRFRVQNDARAARSLLAMESQDHDSFLLPNPESELAKLGKTDALRFSFTRLQGDTADFTFRVGGFKDVRAALKTHCPSIP